jgi:hypothetical protein
MDAQTREMIEQMLGGPIPPRFLELYARYQEISARVGGPSYPSINVIISMIILAESESPPKPKPKPRKAKTNGRS